MAAIVYNPQESWTVSTGIDVTGSQLNDTIVNGAYPEDSLVGAYGSDQYEGHNIRIWGNEGKDVILNHGYNVVIYGGDDNDSIRNFGSNVRISGNAGSDKFIISGASENNTITDFTDGEDELWFEQGALTAEIDTYYTKHSVVIKSAETGDTLVRLEGVTSGSSNRIVWYKDDGGTMSTNIDWLLANSATTDSSIKNIAVPANGKLNNTLDNAIITATTGNNSIENSGNTITINGGSGNDTITNSGTDVKINGNDGDDFVSNNGGNNVSIDGGKGKDTIFSSGNDVSIFGGDDNDRISNHGSNVTIEGDAGDDSIRNGYYADSDYGASVMIDGGDGNDYLYNRGDNSTINGGIGDDEIHNFGASIFVIGGSGKDEISNTGNNVTIDSGDGNDSVDNLGSNVSINSGDGNDTITNRGANATNVTINSGNGDDSINNIKSKVTIISGSGDDTIYNDGSNVLIDSGTGNDSIHNRAGSNITFNYRNGDGNDTIDGLKEFPTINILGGSYSSVTSGNDVIITVGDGSITLKDAKGTSLNIIGTYTPDTTPSDDGGDDTPTTYKTQQDVIKAFMHSLDENKASGILTALNKAIVKASDGIFTNLDDLLNRFFYDYQNTIKFDENNNITDESADKFLKLCCGINLDNDDTGAITGFDAGGSTSQKNTYDIVPENASNYVDLSEYSYGALDSLEDITYVSPVSLIGNMTIKFKKKGLTVIVPHYDLLTEKESIIVNGLYSWWIEEALNLIEQSYGLTFDSNATVNEITLEFVNTGNNAVGSKLDLYNIFGSLKETLYGDTANLGLKINTALLEDLDLTSFPSGKMITTEFNQNDEFLLDRTLAHELTHAIMRSTMKWFNNFPKYVTEGIAELTIGADDKRDLIRLLQNETRLRNVFYDSPADDDDSPYGGGYMLWRYFAKQVSDNSKLQFPNGVYYYDGNKTMLLINSPFKGTINLTEYPYTVKHIYATSNSSKLTLIGDTTDNAIWASKGGSEMIGGRGDDVLTGGNGSDTFVYALGDGNDIFKDISSNDKIKLTSGTVDSWSISGHDVILKIGEGSITLKNAKSKKLTFIDSSGTETTKTYDNETQADPSDTPLELNPVISSTISRIKARASENVVTDLDSLDDFTDNRTSILIFTENSGRGIQNVNLRSSEYSQVVSLESGNQKVQFNDKNGNIAIVGASATGSKNIIFGNGDDIGIFYAPNANSNVTVGRGRDSIITDNNAHVRVDMTGNNEAKIIPYSGRVILDNYNPDSRAEIVITDVTDITGAIKNNSIQLVGNEVRPNSSTRIELNDSDDSNIVNLTTEHGNTQRVGFTGINGGSVDTDTLHGNFLLKGNYAEKSSDNQKRKPSTLISGKGNDTILAGARDFVDGGDGKNQIYLTPYDLRQKTKDGATIASSGNGRNTVHGFHEGFGYDDDVIQVDDLDNLKFKFYNDGLILTSNDSRLKFDGIGTTSASTDDSTNSLGTDKAELIQITNGSSIMRTAVAQTNQSILVQEDDYITPNAFFGNRSGLNFSEYSDSVEINLADGTGKIGMWDATFSGINKLQAGDGMSTLIGDSSRNTLIAGNGYTSMWGGAGNDKLIGKGNSADKDSRTTFFFFAGDGRDVISDFTFLTPDNRYDGIDDRINVGDSDINDAYSAGNNVVIVFDQNSYLILEDAVGKDFRIANMIAKVDRNIAYDGLADCYVASGGSSLTVDSTVDSAEIWLDNSHGTQFFGNIRTLDASAVEGNTSLVGNEFDNTILAGHSDSSLWGGFTSSNDLLVGGNSRNTFFYCMGNGNDTIQGTNDKDFVILADVSLDQIIETSITADSVSIRFNDGGSLQIKGTSDVTYQLADGSKYSANHQRFEWDSR